MSEQEEVLSGTPAEEAAPAPAPRKRSEIARVITDKLLITNEIYDCTLIKNRIISVDEQRQELESIMIRKGDKVVVNLKNKDDVKNFIDLCWNITMQLTREITGITQQGNAPLVQPTSPPKAPPVNHYVAMGDTMVPDIAADAPVNRNALPPDAHQNRNEVNEAFAQMERARMERTGGVRMTNTNPYANVSAQARMDAPQTMTEALGIDGIPAENLTPEMKARINQMYGDVDRRLKADDQKARVTNNPIDVRNGKSKLKMQRDAKRFGKRQ